MKNIVLIPYRNREKHLEYFLKHSAPKLKDELDNFELLVIEQSADNKLFNRGKLLNVGFDYCNDSNNYYIHHDVDVNPNCELSFKKYNTKIKDNEIHKLFYSNCNTLGGILKIKGSLFKKINGFPNNYWGWGAEDKNLQNRADFFNTKYKLYVNKKFRKGDKFLIFNDNHNRKRLNYNEKFLNDYHKFKNMNKKQKINYIFKSGLNNLKYKIIEEIEINEYCKKIIVEI